MKINALNVHSNQQKYADKEKKNVSFKSFGGSVLSAPSSIMQGIEKLGYMGSFLVQDALGMTLPRVWTGFNRDKEITGEYNTQEGLEVLGREGLTGPYMMIVAPAMVSLFGLFCKSANTNTALLKRISKNFKEALNSPEFNNTIKNDKDKFKQFFYKYNIEKIYKENVPGDKNYKESIDYLLNEFKTYESSKDSKAQKKAISNIKEYINSKLSETSQDFLNLNKLFMGEGKDKSAFGLSEVMEALKDFGTDAIEHNKDFASIDEKAVENIKNNFAAKRLLFNISNIVVTLGGLAVIPKLYVRGDVSPGAKSMQLAQEKMQKENAEKEKNAGDVENPNNGENPSFKGRGINNEGFLSKIGKFVTQTVPDKIHQLFEYQGKNFTKTMFACLAVFGLLIPRGLQAWKRAQVDDNGKRDMTEIKEILLRDTVSSLSVVFAVPMLTKLLVRSYEDSTGFVLTNRASTGKNFLQKAWDIIWPYSDLEVLSLDDLNAIYGNVNNKSKLMNLAEFVDKKGGDLEKIVSKSENASEIFNKNTFTLESLKGKTKAEKNSQIIELFKKLTDKDNKAIEKLMKGTGDVSKNKIAKFARNMNSLPGFISTFVISPIFLGVLLPKLTYYFTRKSNEKSLAEKNS